MFETILLPIDPSKESLDTTHKAIELAKNHGEQVIMLSVLESEESNETVPNTSISLLLQKTQAAIEHAGISYKIVERKGNPAFVICDVADELNADVIVIGTQGLDLQSEAESTASKVIELAPCPVFVVP